MNHNRTKAQIREDGEKYLTEHFKEQMDKIAREYLDPLYARQRQDSRECQHN